MERQLGILSLEEIGGSAEDILDRLDADEIGNR